MIYGNKFLNYGLDKSFDMVYGIELLENDLFNIDELFVKEKVITESVDIRSIVSKIFTSIKNFGKLILKWISNFLTFLSNKLLKFYKKFIDHIKTKKDKINSASIKEDANYNEKYNTIEVKHVRIKYNDTRDLIRLLIDYGDIIFHEINENLLRIGNVATNLGTLGAGVYIVPKTLKHQKEYDKIKELITELDDYKFSDFFESQRIVIDNKDNDVSKVLIDHIENNTKEINTEQKDLQNLQNYIKTFERTTESTNKTIDNFYSKIQDKYKSIKLANKDDVIYTNIKDQEEENIKDCFEVMKEVVSIYTQYSSLTSDAIDKIIKFHVKASKVNLQSVLDINKYLNIDQDVVEQIKKDFAVVSETPKERARGEKIYGRRYGVFTMDDPVFKKM